jgi:hypothetical protein
MTGKSLPWKMTPEELKEFIEYCKKPVSACLIMGGTGLILEHLFTFDGFDLLDFWGHEYVGGVMILAGLLVSTKWSQWRELKLWNVRNWLR